MGRETLNNVCLRCGNTLELKPDNQDAKVCSRCGHPQEDNQNNRLPSPTLEMKSVSCIEPLPINSGAQLARIKLQRVKSTPIHLPSILDPTSFPQKNDSPVEGINPLGQEFLNDNSSSPNPLSNLSIEGTQYPSPQNAFGEDEDTQRQMIPMIPTMHEQHQISSEDQRIKRLAELDRAFAETLAEAERESLSQPRIKLSELVGYEQAAAIDASDLALATEPPLEPPLEPTPSPLRRKTDPFLPLQPTSPPKEELPPSTPSSDQGIAVVLPDTPVEELVQYEEKTGSGSEDMVYVDDGFEELKPITRTITTQQQAYRSASLKPNNKGFLFQWWVLSIMGGIIVFIGLILVWFLFLK